MIPGGTKEQGAGKRPLAIELALLCIVFAVVARTIFDLMVSGSPWKGTPFEQAAIAFFIEHRAFLAWTQWAATLGAAALLAGFIVATRSLGRYRGERSWATVILGTMVFGSFTWMFGSAQGLLQAWHGKGSSVLLILAAFQLSIQPFPRRDGPRIAGSPGIDRAMDVPGLAWFLDSALLAGAFLGLAEWIGTLISRPFAFPDGWSMVSGVLLIAGLHMLLAVLLASALWAALSIMVRLHRFGANRWHRTNLDFVLACFAAAIVSIVVYVGVYHVTYNQTTYLRFVPDPLDGILWCFILFTLSIAFALPRSRRALPPDGRTPGWFWMYSALHALPGLLVPRDALRSPRMLRRIHLAVLASTSVAGAVLFWYAALFRCLSYGHFFLPVASQGLIISILAGIIFFRVLRQRSARASRPGTMKPAALLLSFAGPGALCIVLLIAQMDPDTLSRAMINCKVFRGTVKTLRGLMDFDRDGYARLLGGNDPDDFDASRSPVEAVVSGAREDSGRASGRSSIRSVSPLGLSAKGMSLLIVTVDALRADSLGCYGYGRPTTPRIDALARDAVIFKQCLTVSSATYGSTWALATGRYASRWTGRGLQGPSFIAALRNSGKMAISSFNASEGPDEAPSAENSPPVRILPSGRSRDLFPMVLKSLEGLPSGGSFCAWVHVSDVHFNAWPLLWDSQPDGLQFGESHRDLYDNNLSALDGAFGRFISGLKDKGLYENTVILISADHGTQFWEHGSITHGFEIYQEVLNVPLIVRIPGVSHCTMWEKVSLLDIAPTIYDLFQLPDPSEPFDGKSLVPCLAAGRDVPDPERRFFFLSGWGDMWAVIAEDRWKLIYGREDNTWELFDLREDPSESRNISGRSEGIEGPLREGLLSFIDRGYGRYSDPHNLRRRLCGYPGSPGRPLSGPERASRR